MFREFEVETQKRYQERYDKAQEIEGQKQYQEGYKAGLLKAVHLCNFQTFSIMADMHTVSDEDSIPFYVKCLIDAMAGVVDEPGPGETSAWTRAPFTDIHDWHFQMPIEDATILLGYLNAVPVLGEFNGFIECGIDVGNDFSVHAKYPRTVDLQLERMS